MLEKCYWGLAFGSGPKSWLSKLFKRYTILFGPEYSSDDSGDGPSDDDGPVKESLVKKTNIRKRSNSAGAKLFRKKAKEPTRKILNFSDDRLDDMVQRQRRYCEINCHDRFLGKGCFMDAFKVSDGVYDSTQAYKYIRDKHGILNGMDTKQRYAEASRLFQEHSALDTNTGKWKHNWNFKYQVEGGLRTKNCCFPCFADIHGFTKCTLEKVAKVIKEERIEKPERTLVAESRITSKLDHKPFLDSTPDGRSFNEIEQVFRDNCFEPVPDKMIRAALTPMKSEIGEKLIFDKVAYALQWLERHLDNFADVSPNSDLVKVHSNTKEAIYLEYLNDRGVKKTGQFISRNKFLELWFIIFPNAKLTPWCNIPGKCNICYEIDKERRATTDDVKQKHLRDCHTIHRGVIHLNINKDVLMIPLLFLFRDFFTLSGLSTRRE